MENSGDQPTGAGIEFSGMLMISVKTLAAAAARSASSDGFGCSLDCCAVAELVRARTTASSTNQFVSGRSDRFCFLEGLRMPLTPCAAKASQHFFAEARDDRVAKIENC